MFSKRATTAVPVITMTPRAQRPCRVVAGAVAAVLGAGLSAAVHTGDGGTPVRVGTTTAVHDQIPAPVRMSPEPSATPVPGGATAPVDPPRASPSEPPPIVPEPPAGNPEVASAARGATPLQVTPAGGRTPVVALPIAKVSLVSARCADALAAVQGAGLLLHEGTAFRCPGNTQTFPGDRQHWGVACWEHKHFCATGSYIAANTDDIGPSNHSLRYVVAHEICHINSYIATGGPGTEDAADACAEDAGFPRRPHRGKPAAAAHASASASLPGVPSAK